MRAEALLEHLADALRLERIGDVVRERGEETRMTISKPIIEALSDHEALLSDWTSEQLDEMNESESVDAQRLREQLAELLSLLRDVAARVDSVDVTDPAWENVRDAVTRIATLRAKQGFSLADTATLVFSLKRPLFARLRRILGEDADQLFEDVWQTTLLIDGLGLVAMEAQHDVAERIIAQQRSELMEVSTPVIKLWDGLLVMPLIGTLDSHRAQLATETLLETVMNSDSEMVLLDIQGVPTVDTLVAQHIVKTVKALRLMGAEGIVSGIGPQVAQTMVQLGVDLQGIQTTSNLAAALRLAFERAGIRVSPSSSEG